MHLGKSQDGFKYTMTKDDHPIELEITTLEKDLGVHVDPSLTFSAHCEQQVNKANRLLGLIRRSYTYIDGDSRGVTSPKFWNRVLVGHYSDRTRVLVVIFTWSVYV